MPKDRTDLEKWAEYFVIVRNDVLKERGEDIAEDPYTMFTWFCMIYMNGYDEARVKQMLRQAGVEDIEGYLKTLD